MCWAIDIWLTFGRMPPSPARRTIKAPNIDWPGKGDP